MSYNLFLDDVREPWQVGNYILPVELRSLYRLREWVIVRNYGGFIACIKEKGLPDMVSFDHDLAEIHYRGGLETFGYYEETGLDCMKWMLNYIQDNSLPLPETILVHSMNPIGAENIQSLLNNFKKHYIWDLRE